MKVDSGAVRPQVTEGRHGIDESHLLGEAGACGAEEIVEHLRHGEQTRSRVEGHAVVLGDARLSASPRERFEDRDSVSRCSEPDRRGEPTDSGADDDNLFAHGATSRFDRSA